jgi:hypothetical protein
VLCNERNKQCNRVRLCSLEPEKGKSRNQRGGDDFCAAEGREMNSSSVDMHKNMKAERGAPEKVAIQK